MEYDLVVIGGGPGGYTGAIRAAKMGMRVALIEKEALGGTCLNRGCIPTKALLHSAEMFAQSAEWQENGITAQSISFDQNKVYERKQRIVEGLRNGINSLIKANKIDLYTEKGYIKSINTVFAGETELQTKHILIATGSSPSGYDPQRPLEGIENALNSDDVLNSPVDAKSIIIVGGGVIAVEFASYFAMCGKAVTMLVAGERILKNLSKDISLQLSASLKKSGIKIITNAQIESVGANFVLNSTGKIEADAVICALGRKNNTEGIGLENLGLKAGKNIAVDANMYTGVGSVYACGDVTGNMQLAHYAAASAITAVESMLSKPHSMDLSICPSCIYVKPEIAVAGDITSEGLRFGKFMMGGNGKSIIEGVNRGYVKVFANDDDIIVGAELFCVRATDIIGELALAIRNKLSIKDAAAVIHPHPTVMEAVGEALEDFHGLATHKL